MNNSNSVDVMSENTESWKMLANAIIIQACDDYSWDPVGVELFIRSDWFHTLSRGCVDPDLLIEHLKSIGGNYNGQKLFRHTQFQ